MLKEVWMVEFYCKNDLIMSNEIRKLEDRIFATKEQAIEYFHCEAKRIGFQNMEIDEEMDEEDEWFIYYFTMTFEDKIFECEAVIISKDIIFEGIG